MYGKLLYGPKEFFIFHNSYSIAVVKPTFLNADNANCEACVVEILERFHFAGTVRYRKNNYDFDTFAPALEFVASLEDLFSELSAKLKSRDYH